MIHLPCLCLTSRKAKDLVNPYYSTQEVSQMLEIKFTQVLLLIKRKKIVAAVMGKRIMISKQEILRFAEENKIFIK